MTDSKAAAPADILTTTASNQPLSGVHVPSSKDDVTLGISWLDLRGANGPQVMVAK
jgi:hypothetical protein